jgi:hypothetical protein
MDSLCLQQNKYGCQAPYTYIQGMHKYIILVCTSCAIFHVVYSSNISRLFPSMHFPISARATLMEEPSLLSPGRLSCVQSCHGRLKAWKELHQLHPHPHQNIPGFIYFSSFEINAVNTLEHSNPRFGSKRVGCTKDR